MGKGKEHASPITPPVSNPSTQDMPRPLYSDFANYMHGYYGPVPYAWLPPFVPRPDVNPYPWSSQQNLQYPLHAGPTPPMMLTARDAREMQSLSRSYLPPFVPRPDANPYPWRSQPNIAYPFQSTISPSTGLNATSSRRVEEIKEATPDSREAEALSSSSLGNTVETKNDNGKFGTHHIVHNDGGDSIDEPKSGMLFTSEEELITYYKRYSKQCGFGVMTQRSVREKNGSVRYVTLGCARGGKARNRMSNVTRPRPTRKTDCKAKINVIKIDGMLQVTTVHNTHNHSLSPQKSTLFRCNREVSESRHLRLEKGDARALCEYFAMMQYKSDGFFTLMDFDDDSRLRNVFWADARSRAAYKHFGDVVTFDTTYLKNRYGMPPFAPFVGVNHHGQSILLGVGLISSEDTKTFTWLFETWLSCMDGKVPKAIITDQDRAIKNAIAIVFPDSRHRFCLWHILKKVSEKLGSHSAYNTGLKSQLLKCVYDSQTIEEFESCWDVLITTYNLHENAWLQSLYIERGYWAPVFQKDFFWAGMSTTQQSESVNSFFDGFVHARTNLKEFVDQFDNALRKKIENENEADFHSLNVTIPCISVMPFEKRFQELYTNSKFKEVQQEIIGIINCFPVLQQKDGVSTTYLVEDEVRVDYFIKEVTYFNEAECEAKCSCGLFEMRGILCRHILAIFKIGRVRSLPDKYILDRWRKDIKRKYTLIRSGYDVADQRPEARRYSCLLNICYDVITNAASCDEHTEDMVEKLYVMNDVYRTNKPPHRTGSNVGVTTVDTTTTSTGSSKKMQLGVDETQSESVDGTQPERLL